MNKRPDLILSVNDYDRLVRLAIKSDSEELDFLLTELGRATLVSADKVPAPVVRMNSVVTFKDFDTDEVSEVTLVYPQDADLQQKKISVLAPMGSALIGLSEGQSIEWTLPNGKTRQVQVLKVLYDKK